MRDSYQPEVPKYVGGYAAHYLLEADAGCGSVNAEVRSGYQTMQNLFRGQGYQYLFQKTESGISRLSTYEGLNLGNPNLVGNFITDSMLNGDISYHNVCKLLGIAPGMDTISYIGGIEVTEEDRLVDGVYSAGNAEELAADIANRVVMLTSEMIYKVLGKHKVKDIGKESEEERRERIEELASLQRPMTEEEKAEMNRLMAEELADPSRQLDEKEKEEAKKLIEIFDETGDHIRDVEQRENIGLLEAKTDPSQGMVAGFYDGLPFTDAILTVIDWQMKYIYYPLYGSEDKYKYSEELEVAAQSFPEEAAKGYAAGSILSSFFAFKALKNVPLIKQGKVKLGNFGGKVAAALGLGTTGQKISASFVGNIGEGVLLDMLAYTMPNAVENVMAGEKADVVLEGIITDTGESICSNVVGEMILGGIIPEATSGITGKVKSTVLETFDIGGNAAKSGNQVMEEVAESTVKNSSSVMDDAIEGGSDVIQSKFNELLNSDYYKTDFGYDCSEIAQDFYDAAGQQGKIYCIEGKSGYINGYEYNNQVEYIYHEVYSDGTYIYDPRYTNVPMLKDDYFRALREINPDGFDVLE